MAGFVERSREEGRQEGREESCLAIASRLIRNTSMDDAGIAEITELSEAEIRALRQKTAR